MLGLINTEEHVESTNYIYKSENFFQMISQKYVLLNRFFTLIPEMTYP
jgi:hypothetical protein